MSVSAARFPADRLDPFAAGLMVVLTMSWGMNQVAIKLANDGFGPLFQGGLRSLVGGLLVYMWCRYRRIPLFQRDGTLVAGLVAGAMFGGEFVLIYIGLDYTSAARATLFINTMPIFAALGAHLFLGERLSPLRVVGLVAAFAGVYLVFSDRLSLPSPEAIRGDILCLVAGFLWAATTILIKRTRLRDVAAEKTLLYQLVVSAVMLLPLSLVAGPLIREPGWMSGGALAYQTFYVVAVTYVLWFWLMRRYPAGALSTFTFLSPVFGVLFAGLVLDEPLSPRILGALALIGAGIALVNRPARRGQP